MTKYQALKVMKKEFPTCKSFISSCLPCRKEGIAINCHGYVLTVMPDKTILNRDGQELEYQKFD